MSALNSILNDHFVMHLATLQDHPYSTPLYYAAQWILGDASDLILSAPHQPQSQAVLLFVSDPRSQHSRMLAQNPRVSASIAHPSRDVKQLRGLQLQGWVQAESQWSKAAIAQVQMHYLEQHPQARARLQAQREQQKARFYGLRVTWAKSTDNRVAFGHHENFDFNFPQFPEKPAGNHPTPG